MRLGRRRTVSFVGRTGVGWALAMVMLVTTACSDGRGSQTGATVPSGDTPTTSTSLAPTTTTAVESYDVPEVIDLAYVQRVVSAYDKILGDAIRVLKREGVITEEFLSHLLAIYTEDEFDFQQRVWLESVAEGRVAKTPVAAGDPVTPVLRLERSDAECIVARAERDFSPTIIPGQQGQPSPEDNYVVLVRKIEGRDPGGFNPTPWVMSFDGFKNDNGVPSRSCP